jgi:hypothetical protein
MGSGECGVGRGEWGVGSWELGVQSGYPANSAACLPRYLRHRCREAPLFQLHR